MIQVALADTTIRVFLRMRDDEFLYFEHFPALRFRVGIDRKQGFWELNKHGAYEVVGVWPAYTAKAIKYNLAHRVDVVFSEKLAFQDAKYPCR